MPRLTAALDRRLVLRGLAALPLAAALPRPLRAAESAAILLAIADLHSPYARLPALLQTIRSVREQAGGRPMAMLINGDVFERGNVVATRSGAAADWAFLRAVAAEMPLVINLGNHETAILDDMGAFVARATAIGAQPIGNLVDRRTGRFFAPVSARLGLGGLDIAMLGIGTDTPFVYRPPARATLTLLDPAAFAADAFAEATGGAALPVLASHAGVAVDRRILPGLPAGSVAIGAHDHLNLHHDASGVRYLHAGAWGGQLAVMHLARAGEGEGVAVETEMRAIAPGGGDEALAAEIEALKAEHLTDADRAVIAERDRALDLPASILLAAEAVRAATGADIAVLGHTTFGAPLAAGPLTKYDFDAFIRFDGDIRVADIPGGTLARIMTRANQHRAASLDARTGDFVHAAEIDIDPAATYRVATNGWTAMNQQTYLGTEGIDFRPVEGAELKAIVADALASG